MAAVSSTSATTLYISGPPGVHKRNGAKYCCILSLEKGSSKLRRSAQLVVRSSSDAGGGQSSSGSAATTEVEEGGWEGSIEVPEGPPSLISALNVERALRGIPITDVDHYAVLGLRRGCSYEEVTAGYKNKVDEVLNKGLEEEQVRDELGILKDWSLARNDNPEKYSWPSQSDITQIASPETPPILQEPEDDGPTRAVGYFLLGWFVLSVVLSIALNR
ncbi:unnamed protein product [Linum tenue]|uniref:Uncharacterized protein n=1 Tax=Linum tenue TaxID=586396 RepID=A0AAV0MPX8_9ROSI|nr:unnamed protein product [Linum tenue]